jgi:predicted amidohydrolase
MKVSALQIAVVEGNKDATLRKAERLIRNERDADLIILPELWNVGFHSFDRYVREAEDELGPTVTCLKDLAAELNIHIHTGSLVESDNGRYYNTSYLLSPQGQILGKYRKIHLFGFQSKETQLLQAGTEVTVVETQLGNLGMATCYDLRFPELFRRMASIGAELFLVCSAWPYPRLETWIMLNRVRALENQVFLVSANSVGPNQGATFVGHSMAVNPWGTIMSSGGDEEVVLRTDLDLQTVESVRKRFPPWVDRKDWL